MEKALNCRDGDGNKPSSKVRNSNLELYRIIVMLLIVASHYVNNSNLMDANGALRANPLAIKSLVLTICGMWGKTGINCFVLITGYFMCTSNISIKKYFRLLFEIYFYRFFIYMLFLLTGLSQFNAVSFIKMFFPVTNLADNFTGCFVVFYLTIPFLSILVRNMTKKLHLLLLLLCFVVYVVIGTIPTFGIRFNYVSWFGVLFFIASYIRLYEEKWFSSIKLWGILSLLSIFLSVLSVLAMTWIGVKIGMDGLSLWFVADSNKALAVTTSITTFMLFKNLQINNSKIINSIASSTFGVLLIHTNSDVMRQWLWNDMLNNAGAYDSRFWLLHLVGSVFVVFITCTLIDQIRIRFIEKPVMAKLSHYEWFA